MTNKRWHCEDCGASGAGAFDELHACVLAQPEPAAVERIECNLPFERVPTSDNDNGMIPKLVTAAPPEPLARDMTKRERFAMEMLAGMLDAMCRCEVDDMNQRKYAQFAVEMADELLAALEVK